MFARNKKLDRWNYIYICNTYSYLSLFAKENYIMRHLKKKCLNNHNVLLLWNKTIRYRENFSYTVLCTHYVNFLRSTVFRKRKIAGRGTRSISIMSHLGVIY